ncbi:MAG: hypothetical protein JWM11_1558 [Planctomycetaceae bacterium]|nr:hypothetical protein [Planctomycetaceae bacterium]
MRRFIAVMAVIGCGACLHGIYFARPISQNQALAENVALPGLPGEGVAEITAVESHQGSTASTTPDAARSYTHEINEIKGRLGSVVGNRFDRGRLGEEYDGEQIRKKSSHAPAILSAPDTQIAQEESPFLQTNSVVGAEIAQLDEPAPPRIESLNRTANADPFVTPALPQNPQESNPRLVPVPRRGDVQTPHVKWINNAPYAVSGPVPASVPRVTLIVGQDHQIRILPEAKTPPGLLQQAPAPSLVGSLVITAEEFNLTPPTEPGAGNQLTCSGNVQLRSQRFVARCNTLSFKGSEFVLEGSAQSRVEIRQQGTEGGSEFDLSAKKISFSLSLDKIQISEASTLLQSTPSVPGPAEKASIDPGKLRSRFASDEESTTPPIPPIPTKPRTKLSVYGGVDNPSIPPQPTSGKSEIDPEFEPTPAKATPPKIDEEEPNPGVPKSS